MTVSWEFPPRYYERSLRVFETALNSVPVYESWRSLDPGRKHAIDARFAAMPATSKRNIRENFPGGILPPSQDVNLGLKSGEISLVETAGTTDDKIINIWNQKWWDASERASWKLNAVANRITAEEHREAILANPRNVGFISDTIDLPIEKRRLSRFLYLNEKTDPTSWTSRHMDRMIEELDIFKPAILEANPSLLARLSRYIADTGKQVFQPGIIIFTYEYPGIIHYRQIRRVFNVPLASSYGTTETGYVFMQCEEGKFHQNSDFCRVDFQPLKSEHGGPLLGRILVTPFGNAWSYLLRFDVGDLVYLEKSGKCPCGRDSGLILSAMGGRVTNLTLTCDGRLVSLYELDNAVSTLTDIDAYKLYQLNQNSYELHLVSQVPDKTRLVKNASEILKKLYGKAAQVSVICEADIAPEGSGKYLISRALFPIKIDEYLE